MEENNKMRIKTHITKIIIVALLLAYSPMLCANSGCIAETLYNGIQNIICSPTSNGFRLYGN